MSGPEFDIVIGPTGRVTVTVKGAKGPRCLQYADLIKQIVGREEQRQYTAEYYAPEEQVRIDTQVHGKLGG
jgi:hypothetical protein